MKFIIDENIPHSLIVFLKEKHFEVLDVKNSSFKQETDANLAQLAIKENWIILTFDKDFLGIQKRKIGLKCIFLQLRTLNVKFLRDYIELVIVKCQNLPEKQGFFIFCQEQEISIIT